MSAPTHAYVEYQDGGKAIVSVSLIKDFSPNDMNDLACNKRIYWKDHRKGFEGEEGYYSGNIMVLGCGKADLIARMSKQHKPVRMDVFEQSSERHRHMQKPALKDVPTKEKRRRLESAKKSRMQKILEKKSAAGDTDSSSEDDLVPRKMLKKAENEIAGLKNKLRISEQQRIEERQQNQKLHSLLEERMNSMEASIIEALRKEVRAARLPSQGCAANVCSDDLQQTVREAPMKPCEDNFIQENSRMAIDQQESTTLYEDLDLGTAPMDGALPAHCESTKPSCVLGPREEVAGSQVASHVPSTHNSEIKINMKGCRILSFGDVPVNVTPHRTMNTSRGVVFDSDLIDLTEAELLEGWGDQNVISVKRIKMRGQSQYLQSWVWKLDSSHQLVESCLA
ncbi:uncharacterized protein [Dermacentor andersoni]|uniref:uncharacterized protein n=1 Tax=Dermacentor andersoni TaxID=34620 RepID=UPI003B3B09AD